MLYLVATPIGNLSDLTFRALEILKSVDGIICEDSRRTSILLNHYQIPKKPLIILNDYNEAKVLPQLISNLGGLINLALVSDAGTPLISDPGYKLVRECLARDIQVDSIPGPSSVITALTLSGLPPDKFLFLGYPPEKQGHRIKLLKSLCGNLEGCKLNPGTIIMFASPYKIIKNLEDMKDVFGDIEVTLAQELTKIHQSVNRKLISEWLDQFKAKPPKGEMVLLFRLENR